MTVRHWSMLVLTAALFGSSFFFIKLAISEIPPFAIAAGRALLAAAVVLTVVLAGGGKISFSLASWRIFGVVGVLTAVIPYAGIAAGQNVIDSSLGGILFGTIPIFTVLLAPILLDSEVWSVQRMGGALIGLAGVIAILGFEVLAELTGQILGSAATLLAAISYALGGIYARKHPEIFPTAMAAGQLLVAAPILLFFSAIVDAPWTLEPSISAIAALGAVGILCTAAPVLLFFRLIREIGPARTSLLTFLMPVVAVALGTIVLGEQLDWASYVGFGLIVLGAIAVSRPPGSPAASTSASNAVR